jgi:hypothetical protein
MNFKGNPFFIAKAMVYNIWYGSGDFYDHAARAVMCEAYHQKMTAKEGFVWFLPVWFMRVSKLIGLFLFINGFFHSYTSSTMP